MRIKRLHITVLVGGCLLITVVWFLNLDVPTSGISIMDNQLSSENEYESKNKPFVIFKELQKRESTISLSKCKHLLTRDRDKMADLEALAKRLQDQVDELQTQIKQLQPQQNGPDTAQKPVTAHPRPAQICQNYSQYYNPDRIIVQQNLAEINHGLALHNEYELVPFVRFTKDRVYIIKKGLGWRVVEKPIGFTKKELTEVIEDGRQHLNTFIKGVPPPLHYEKSDFTEGIYRTVPAAGTQYELYFSKPSVASHSNISSSYRITLFRPFASLQSVKIASTGREQSRLINLILPLSQRLRAFKKFMERFVAVCINYDHHVMLTIVYFGSAGVDEVRSQVARTRREHPGTVIELLLLDETFSRARGLQEGARAWHRGYSSAGDNDVLLFLCDVDIAFSADFLHRCRHHASPGEKVYFPIVFSLYNPSVVYRLQDKAVPPEHEQFVISKHTGWWRLFGYGMACVYHSDYLSATEGVSERIVGWGMEDVHLYRKFIHSALLVVRASDPGIFHVWHQKVCDPRLATDQYRACIHSKALNEASHAQLGLLAFRDEVNLHLNTTMSQRRAAH